MIKVAKKRGQRSRKYKPFLCFCSPVPDTVDEDDFDDGEEELEFPTSQPSLLPEDEEEKVPPPTEPPYVPTPSHAPTQPPATPPMATPPPDTPPPDTPPPQITTTLLEGGEPEKILDEDEGMTDNGKKRDATEKTVQREFTVNKYHNTLQSSAGVWLPVPLLLCLTTFSILNI